MSTKKKGKLGDWLRQFTCKLFGHNYHYWVTLENPDELDNPGYARLRCLRCNRKWTGKEVYKHMAREDKEFINRGIR